MADSSHVTDAVVKAILDAADDVTRMRAELREKARRAPLVPDAVAYQTAIDALETLEAKFRADADVIARDGLHFTVTYARPA